MFAINCLDKMFRSTTISIYGSIGIMTQCLMYSFFFFLPGLVIFIGIIILAVWHRLTVGCYISGAAGVFLLSSAGLSATAVIDLNTNK